MWLQLLKLRAVKLVKHFPWLKPGSLRKQLLKLRLPNVYRYGFELYFYSTHKLVKYLKHIIPSWATAFMQKYSCRIKMRRDILRKKACGPVLRAILPASFKDFVLKHFLFISNCIFICQWKNVAIVTNNHTQ